MSSEDKNKALARRFLKAFANADLNTLDELLAPEFINHNPLPGQDPGRKAICELLPRSTLRSQTSATPSSIRQPTATW